MSKQGIYIHVPWCHRRCPYCDFYFDVGTADEDYGMKIAAELELRRQEVRDDITSIYFGGGTPSVLDTKVIDGVLAAVRSRFDVSTKTEITLEANPEDISEQKLLGWKNAGVTRLSLGAQSFQKPILAQLGRVHSQSTAESALRRASKFFSTSVDLIIGVPGESASRIHQDVAILSEAGAHHVSAYMLTVEPGTPWERQLKDKRRTPIDDDQQADAYELLRDLMVENAFAQYEISSFAKPGHESVHNRTYWSQGEYIGVGPGAHSMRVTSDGGVVRRQNVADWTKYSAAYSFTDEKLSSNESFLEAVAFGLRDLQAGISLDELCSRFGVTETTEVTDLLQSHCGVGESWLAYDGGRYRINRRGVLFADAIAREILGLGAQTEAMQ